ncbi:MAG: type II toxin-antitoxin system VapC family toxin [Saccharofermentans sp.]|nr:type II toxin-antitoxin system VapC family toxin [Saccharofermentans sp.]
MNILLDTHVLIWCFFSAQKIPDEIKDLITDPENNIFYSSLSVWEIGLKHAKRPREMPVDSERIIKECKKTGFLPLSLCNDHVLAESELVLKDQTIDHKDPFDRMLLSQALSEDMVFITHDPKMKAYDVPKMICF